MNDLTILCVTEGGAHARPFLAEMADLADELHADIVAWPGEDAGCIEAVLDAAVAGCPAGYILRLDDDERVSPEMREWLRERWYREHDHWAFPRLNFWPDEQSVVCWPDLQTRLSVKAKSGGRPQVHMGSPFGTGRIASVAIEHHKFLVRPVAERRALVARYERLQPGAGEGFRMFSVPEDCPGVVVESVSGLAPVGELVPELLAAGMIR